MEDLEMLNNFLEACSSGDIDSVNAILESGATINGQQKMNGWTGLHWAVKRGHTKLVTHLLNHGADANVKNTKGETPGMLTEEIELKKMLGDAKAITIKDKPLPFLPNYLAYPEFTYARSNGITKGKESTEISKSENMQNGDQSSNTQHSIKDKFPINLPDEDLVIKTRIADITDKDFIEIDFEKSSLTFEKLLTSICQELMISKSDVIKLRKLPNTILRNDKDVQRLSNFQELEVILKFKF